jgi:4-amino-4-deoxy-L-arabinose transferase-like glycosyltransferase
MIDLSSKRTIFFLLAAVTAFGFFLRAYHFSDWLHFELDQARDARIVDDGLRGDFFDLPLLGPKAGGTTLRLPPGFYYLEYLSATIFGGTPYGMAMLGMILSALSVPLFYLFTRRYFSVRLALLLALLFSVSEFFVMYGRFAWNPNLIPFFALLGFYALLRAADHEEQHKERWFVVAAFGLALAMQMHSLAFVAIPLITGAFLALRRPRLSWKAWLGAAVVVSILYLPMVLNETETGWANAKAFIHATTEKSTKNDHSLVEKAFRDVAEHAMHGTVILTGFEGTTFPVIDFYTKEGKFVGWACDARCDRGKWYGVAAVLTLLASLFALATLWFRESVRRKSDFLLLSGLWFAVAFCLFLPLSYDMAPRFFLVSGPVFFVLIGALLFALKSLFGERKIGRQIVFWAVIALVLSNLSSIQTRFDEIDRSQTEAIDSPPDRILKERIHVTLAQQERIVDFLEGRSQETGYPVYMWSEPQYRRALKYLMEKRGIENAVLGFDGVYREGVYYMILRAQSDLEDAVAKYRVGYEIGQTTSFGTLVAVELFPKPETIQAVRQDFSKPKLNDSQGLPRYTWREFFSKGSASSVDDDQPDEMEVGNKEEL